MNILFTEQAWNEFTSIKENTTLGKQIRTTIKAIQRGDATGKEEALKHELSGFYSRRLDQKNRLIFKRENDTLVIVHCGGHYSDK